jgi:hypothetical protein
VDAADLEASTRDAAEVEDDDDETFGFAELTQ